MSFPHTLYFQNCFYILCKYSSFIDFVFIIYGYTGLRITSKGVVGKYKPMLPKNIKELTLQNFYIRGSKYDINAKNNKLTLNKL